MDDESVRVWLVERTYSDDERYFRKERALTSVSGDRETTAAVEVSPDNLGRVTDPDRRDRYATEATRMAETNDPD
jgi:hypothetical protein